MLIMHDWTTNTILTTPIKDAKDKTMMKAFKKNIKYLSKQGLNQMLSIIDNIASKAIRECLQSKDIKFQLV